MQYSSLKSGGGGGGGTNLIILLFNNIMSLHVLIGTLQYMLKQVQNLQMKKHKPCIMANKMKFWMRWIN